ncbi:uncharacterized protein LOC112052721 [Bicyclus anynana]|uniref:Uncharacterized protein LOC112052721 n=1 Tax=Bicyclus anynana TaxID=110368 RepID=A0A6J1NIU5_BICAN|nr:uncharacterized protein LOC112052721 [Bicyclus anynana]
MLSKFLKRLCPCARSCLVLHKSVHQTSSRHSQLLPASQYDVPVPPNLHLIYALTNYWELIPLFVITCTSLTFMTLSIMWACFHKVDVVFSTHSRDNISRTMDLRNPSVHKLIIINQRYEPWPEMQDVLDKMRMAEKRALVRLQTCSHA